jgi:hypothetical protein
MTRPDSFYVGTFRRTDPFFESLYYRLRKSSGTPARGRMPDIAVRILKARENARRTQSAACSLHASHAASEAFGGAVHKLFIRTVQVAVRAQDCLRAVMSVSVSAYGVFDSCAHYYLRSDILYLKYFTITAACGLSECPPWGRNNIRIRNLVEYTLAQNIR